ncbi:MAG TPA: MBL fold metallo-hydrolase [bacterium]|nr:MBL fold metallo-hydrolase [bacterium]
MKNPTWKIVHIGFLPKNRKPKGIPSWEDQACTSTLIETETRRILVDPGLRSTGEFHRFLYQQTGCEPEEIDTIFLTHFHRHHWQSLLLFRKSAWLMSRSEIRWWKKNASSEEEQDILARIVPVEDHPLPGIEILRTPGHVHGLTSLMFETREGIVVVAGDAILTFEHFDNREPSENAEDPREARRSIDRIAKMADIIVPGHDNYFVV